MAITGNLLPANAESIETDASAWRALVNAATPTQTTGGTSGSHCLAVKSVAAGDMQIGLTTRVAVTPNAEHWACASVFPPAVGAQSRIEIRWYTSGGTLISTSQGPMVSAPAATWHQVGAIGTAPATAATADVVLRPQATASTQSWFADRFFLGLTVSSTAGNLLPFNTETVEVDTSGWTASALCTLGVSTSSFTWFQSLVLTSTGAGSALALTASTATVTPGTEYVAYTYVTPGTAGLTQRVQIQWLDSTGTQISVSSQSWTPVTGQWTRCVVVGTAPAGAVSARVGLSPQATASGQQWAYDRIVLAPSSALMPAGDLLPYNSAEFEVDTSGWSTSGATAAQATEQVFNGFYSMRMTATGGDIIAALVTPVPVTPGLGYQFSPYIYSSAARTYITQIAWLDASGATIKARWASWTGRANSWMLPAMGDLAPAGAASARLFIGVQGSSAGELWYMDRVVWSVGGLTALAEPAGGGGVSITLRGLTSGGPSWLWSLDRIVPGQPSAPVRGWTGDLTSQAVTGDVAVATDYEAPLGVPVQYRVTLRNPSGPGLFLYTSDPVTIDASPTSVWLKDPSLPARSVEVTVATPMPSWSTASRQGVNAVRGRALPVIISDVRAGKTGTLTVVTETDDDRAALNWVLASGNTLLLQWPPGWGEDDIYVSVGDVQMDPVVDFAEFHDRTWSLPLTQVDRPVGGITGSPDRTWQTVKDSGTTWLDVLAGAQSWLDIYTGG